ncbi:hypothetical protein CR513_50231, partial [Mucuna pruriens]
MASTFESFTLLHVPRDQNERADLLAKLASTQRWGQRSAPTIDKQEIWCIEGKGTWMDPFITYLKEDRLLEDPAKAKKVPREASKYILLSQHLYHQGFSFLLLRCVDEDEATYVIREVHEGVCGTHIGGRTLTRKIAKVGYYWPALKSDCTDYVKKCDKCQRFTEAHKAPLEHLYPLEEAKGRWAEELPQVLWSYHTTSHSNTNETPFRLMFGTEAMIPVEIGESSPQTTLFEPCENEEELRANLDMLQEVWEIAHVKEYVVKARAARKYDKRIVPRNFKPQDLVESNKLTTIWEVPFRVLEEVGRGAYRIEKLDGRKVPCTWNAATLRINVAAYNDRLKNGRLKKTDPGSDYNRLRSTRPKNGRSKKIDPGSDYNRLRSTRPKTDGKKRSI